MTDRMPHNVGTAASDEVEGSAEDRARLRWHLDRADALFEQGREDEARDVLADAVTFLPPVEDVAA